MPIPSEWRFHLILPPGHIREGSAESEFFGANTPIHQTDVYESISVTYHGLVPAVRDGDLPKLRGALERIHKTGFKSRELSAQTSDVHAVYDQLQQSCEAPVGMSSMGPLLYVVLGADDEGGKQVVRQASVDTSSIYLGAFAGLQSGYTLLP